MIGLKHLLNLRNRPSLLYSAKEILAVLDSCAEEFTFPMLDNGYIFLAATRLSLYHSNTDWAIIIEVFGYAPRAGHPDLTLTAFGSNVSRQRHAEDFVSQSAFDAYLVQNPHNEDLIVYPLGGVLEDANDPEFVLSDISKLKLRGDMIARPNDFAAAGMTLSKAPKVATFELCRLLAYLHREKILATSEERQSLLPDGMTKLVILDDWYHPDLANGEKPSSSPSFIAFAKALVSGTPPPPTSGNTHWRNWPDGGTL